MKEHEPDILQINHSITNRGIEEKVLPIAKELGVAVLSNRNINDGGVVSAGAKEAVAGLGGEGGHSEGGV